MEEELKETTWSHGLEEELVRELLDDVSPFSVAPQEIISEYKSSPSEESPVNRLVSAAHLEPVMEDVFLNVSQARISVLEKGLSKVENKYSLKIKSCGNAMADDGYKWKKYGQKSIKNSLNPRSYYRCTNSRCSAKKQVERSSEDPETFIVTYAGLHLHYAYPYFLPQNGNPPAKKLKSSISKPEGQGHEALPEDNGSPENSSVGPSQGPFVDNQQELSLERIGPQGLLEDVVPLMIRNPSNNHFSSNSSSCSSYPSPPTSPSSLSWPPNYSSSCV